MVLKGENVLLRAIERDDIEILRELINSPEMERRIVGWGFPISKKAQESWFENFKNTPNMIRYTIDHKEFGVVGFTGLKDIDWKNGSVITAGIRILDNVSSKGIASECFKLLLDYCFNELRLNRVQSSTKQNNLPVIKFLTKLGYKEEGILREFEFKNGKYHNLILLSILKSDYDKINGNGSSY